jgi:hypothetical protein
MIALIDTLRHKANADLIITSGVSKWFEHDTELPNQKQLKSLIGGCNECVQFYKILKEHVLGKHWGNVIIFGDQDAPEDPRFKRYKDSWLKVNDYQGTKIDRVMAFHTYENIIPGYGLWTECASNKPEVITNSKWVREMRRW